MSTKPQEHHFLNVPFEALKRISRERKHVLETSGQLIEELRIARTAHPSGKEAENLATRQDILRRIRELHDVAQNINKQEKELVDVLQARLEHVESVWGISAARKVPPEWNTVRFDRILADYLLRARYNQTAIQLIQSQGLEKLVDSSVIAEVQPILKSLRERDCEPALKWCHQRTAKLKRAGSTLEFMLRAQQFIEMVRRGDKLEALQHAKTFLASYSGQNLPEVKEVLVAMVIEKYPSFDQYQRLFGDQRWADLEAAFYSALLQLNSIPAVSPLELYMQAGLIVLNPPQDYPEIHSGLDPWSQEVIRDLAKGLPFARHASMRLICPLSRQIIDHENKGVLLPNKQVVSGEMFDKMKELDEESGKFKFKHPITGETYQEQEWKVVMPV